MLPARLEIQLEPQPERVSGCDVFQRERRQRTAHHAGFHRCRALGAGKFAFGVHECLQCHGCQQQRMAERLPEQLATRVAVAAIRQQPWLQCERLERFAVAAQGVFVAAATIDVRKHRRRQALFRVLFVFLCRYQPGGNGMNRSG